MRQSTRTPKLGARLQSLFKSTSQDILTPANQRNRIRDTIELEITPVAQSLIALEDACNIDTFKRITLDLLNVINALTTGYSNNPLLELFKNQLSDPDTQLEPINLDVLTPEPIVMTQFTIVMAVLKFILRDTTDLIPKNEVTELGFNEEIITLYRETLFYKKTQLIIENIAPQLNSISTINNITAILQIPAESYQFPADSFHAAKLQATLFTCALQGIPADTIDHDLFLHLRENLLKIPQMTKTVASDSFLSFSPELNTFRTPIVTFLLHCSTFLTKYIVNKETLAYITRLLDPILEKTGRGNIATARRYDILPYVNGPALKTIISEMTNEQELNQFFTDFDKPLAKTSDEIKENNILAKLLILDDITFPPVSLACVAQLLRSTPYPSHPKLKLAIEDSLPKNPEEIATLLNFLYLRTDYATINNVHQIIVPIVEDWIGVLSDVDSSTLWTALSDTARYTLRQLQFLPLQQQSKYSADISISSIAGMIKILTDHCGNSTRFYKRPTCWKISALRHATQKMSVEKLQDDPNHVEAMIKLIFIELDRWCPRDGSISESSGTLHLIQTASGDVYDRIFFLANMIHRNLQDIYVSIPHKQKSFNVPITQAQAKKFDGYEKDFFSYPGATYSNTERALILLRDYTTPGIFKWRTEWKVNAVTTAMETASFSTLTLDDMIRAVFTACRETGYPLQLHTLVNAEKTGEFYDILTYLSVLAGKPLTETLAAATPAPAFSA